MNIGILGTGTVGRTLGAKLAEAGHDVMLGTRNTAGTLARTAPDARGRPGFGSWHAQNPGVGIGAYAEAARHGQTVINATLGAASLDALRMAGEANLRGKILIDLADPLDFSQGMPRSLTVCNTDSLAEQIQRAFPSVKVVKTLNTVTAPLMVNPGLVAGGDHTLFLSGNDDAAKAQVRTWLAEWFGWRHVIDLGDITTARGVEMYLPLWLELMVALGTPVFNVKVLQADGTRSGAVV
jgi:predicted dinucleotide-binding enzyme